MFPLAAVHRGLLASCAGAAASILAARAGVALSQPQRLRRMTTNNLCILPTPQLPAHLCTGWVGRASACCSDW